MKVPRQLLLTGWAERYCPPWPCARCGRGTLQLEFKTVAIALTADTMVSRTHEAHHCPYDDDGRFSCVARCDSCKDPVVVAGRVSYDTFQDLEDGSEVVNAVLSPTFVMPPPNLIEIPASCPTKVADELRRAFGLFWQDTGACGNAIRATVDRIMDSIRIKKRARRSAKSRLTTHQRVELLQKRNQAIGDALMAVKWIGNEGSHPGELTRDDLLDALDVLEHALSELFDQRTEKIAAITRRILRHKGPAPAKRHRRARSVRKPKSP